MKRLHRRLLLLITALCALSFAAYYVLSHRGLDTEAPVITFDRQMPELSVRDGESALLDGVTAEDETDGDVTASLVVESISNIRKDHTATVTYVAFDKAGHVTRASRDIHYTDYHSPRFSLSAPLLFRSGVTVDVFQYLTASDLLDGDVSNRIKADLTGGEGNISDEGSHLVEVRVTNSMGDTARLTLPVDVYPAGSFNATLELTEYLLYAEIGADFDPNRFVSTFLAGSGIHDLTGGLPQGAEMTVESNVNTAAAGTYTVTYNITFGSYRACARLIVIVEDPSHA